jgi:hypothetical protein
LAEFFCQGVNAHQASKKLGTSYGTARGHFRKFAAAFEKSGHPASKVLISIRKEKNMVPERWQRAGIKIVYAIITDPTFQAKPSPEASGDYLLVS